MGGKQKWANMTPEQKALAYERTKRYRATEKGRKMRLEENRRYRANHPEFVEAQKPYKKAYYRLYRRRLQAARRARYARDRVTILAKQRDYYKRQGKARRAAEAAEERAIAAYMAGVEADATAIFAPEPERLGIFRITKRAGKRGHGTTRAATVAMRLAARKGEALPPDTEPVVISPERDNPDYHGPHYHERILRKHPHRARPPVVTEQVPIVETVIIGRRQYHGFADGKWTRTKRKMVRQDD